MVRVTPSGDIHDYAGTGLSGYSGDGGPATEAQLGQVYANSGIDADGNLYLADTTNHRVRKVDTAGLITTVAGTGVAGYSGDGGPAREAQLNGPSSVSVDAKGNVYVADAEIHRLRRIDPAGIITILAGNGTEGNADVTGPATAAAIAFEFVWADKDGNVYISGGSRVRKVDTNGLISTVAGGPRPGLSGDGGPPTEAQLSGDVGNIVVAPDGTVYIADSANNRIRKVAFDVVSDNRAIPPASASEEPAPPVGIAGTILFESTRDGPRGIYAINAAGSGVRRVTSTSGAEDWMPNWSPDGSRIAFARATTNGLDIYSMNADGTDERPLTEGGGDDMDPTWSPDGTRIAFAKEAGGGNFDIYLINADGTGTQRLTDDPAGDFRPDWSPGGQSIAFESERDGNAEIYVINADGTGERRLTQEDAEDRDAAWSPDGTTIAFASDRDCSHDIYVMDLDGGRVRQVDDAPNLDRYPAWSPDGSYIAFQSERDFNPEIYVMRADGTGTWRLTDHPELDWHPDWSPSGGTQ